MSRCCSSPSSSSSSPCPPWTDLPQDLLVGIAQALTSYFDLAHFAAVCKPWRRAASAASLPVPYLASVHLHRGEPTMRLNGLTHEKPIRIKLPMEARWWHCWGSSHGWLAMVDSLARPFLFNPLSGDRVDLPDLRTLPGLLDDQLYSKRFRSILCATDGSHIRERIQRELAVKLVLSAPPDDPGCTAVALYTRILHAAYVKPGGDDPSWRLLETSCFNDLAHLDGAFVAFRHKHVVSLFPDTELGSFHAVYIRPTSWEKTPSHFDGLDPVNYWIPPMNSVRPCPRLPGWSSARYVVPIPAGIARVERDQKTVGGPLALPPLLTRTTGFGVYLLDGGCRHEGERWADLVRSRPYYVNERATGREVWDIGDCSLLIWGHHAMCVPVSKATGAWMPNCIYFTEDSGGGGGGGYQTCHLSVYNIQHQTIWRCTTMEGSAINPAWITPSLKFRAGIC